MKNQIIIHAAPNQTRVALIENNELAQLFIESPENQRTVGNIYLAEVHKVMAGIRAAFIDLGAQKDAFLHFSDTGEHLENYLILLNGKDAVDSSSGLKQNETESKKSGTLSVTEIQDRAGSLLAPRQKVLVQIVKEPIGSKGPRVSTNITVAGRFLVLIPMGEYVAISKRIRSHKERRRLRSCLSSVLPDGFGVIVRTLAEGQKKEILHEDLKDVLDKWKAIQEKLKQATPPSLLHQDMDMTESLVRDLFAKDYSRILIDDSKIYRSIKSYVSRVAPNMVPNIELYKGSEHIFDYMKISRDVDSVFSPRVKMPSGGYLIFEQTEAMYVVDVNSGRYAAKRDQEDNSLKTNLESAREIAKQLRLRDIGGIIVVDFIDLRDESNRKKVFDELKREFRKDRAKTNVLPMSDFGLVQITRQRIRPSVVKSVSKVCPMCGGSGSIVSEDTILADIEGWLTKFKYNYNSHFSLDLHINPYLRSMLQKGWLNQRVKWFISYRLNITILGDEAMSMNDFKFMLSNSEIDITDTVLRDQPLEKAIDETDMRIRVERDRKKDSELAYYEKDKKKPAQKGKSGRSGTRTSSNGRSAQRKESPSSSNTATASQKTAVKDIRKKPDQTEASTAAKIDSAAEKRKSAEPASSPSDKSGSRSRVQDKDGSGKTRPQSSHTRRSETRAKYYKSSQNPAEAAGKEKSPGQTQSPSTTQQKNPPTAPEEKNKPSSSAAAENAVADGKSSGSGKSDSTHTPSRDDSGQNRTDTIRPPSALEVARQHRLEKEKETNGAKP